MIRMILKEIHLHKELGCIEKKWDFKPQKMEFKISSLVMIMQHQFQLDVI